MVHESWNETRTTVTPNTEPSREFDQYASSYDELLEDPLRQQFSRDPLHFHRRKWNLLRRVLERGDVPIGKLRWLDVGCGRGELLDLAGHRFAQAMGCDPSEEMIAQSGAFQKRHQPSLSHLPFEDCSVDLVTAVCVYHHVHGAARLLLSREIWRVLAPGGLCCIMEHNPKNPLTRAIVRRCHVDVDAELLTAHETTSIVVSAGFVSPGVDYFLYFPERVFSRVGWSEKLLRRIPLGGQYALIAKKPEPGRTF